MKSSIHAFFLFVIPALVAISAAIFFQNTLLAISLVVIIFIVFGLGVAIPQLKFFGNFICSGSKSKKQIALTFDDGPDPKSTPQLLALLRERKIPATFFCIGKRVDANPELAAQIRREGHLLENHSYAHSYFTNFYSAARLKTELELAQTAIKKAAGVTPNYFRPPVGLSNPNTFRVAKKLNLQVVGWSVRSLDTVIREPEKIVARVKRGLHPGAIILLHDGNIPAEKLLTTVKSLLDTLQKLGYEVVRLDELLNEKT